MTHSKDARLNGRDEYVTWARSEKSRLCLDLRLPWDQRNASMRREFLERVPRAGDWAPILSSGSPRAV